MDVEIRVPEPEEARSVAEVVAISLLVPPPDEEEWEKRRPSWESMFSLAAFAPADGHPSPNAERRGRPIGHVGQFLFDTVVPGGALLPTGGVTRVGVLPTHRRRGVVTKLMEELVAEASRRSLPLLSLRASESGIYGRYGFGVAGEYCTATIDPIRARPVANPAPGTVRLLQPSEILDTVAAVYRRVLDRPGWARPGMITRSNTFWQRYLRSALDRSSASFVAVHHRPGSNEPDGYVHYNVAWADDGTLNGHGEVHDLWAEEPEVELALWQYVFDIDLIRRWQVFERPVDDLIRNAAADRRAYRVESVDDEQWLRLVDVDRALAARTWNAVAGWVTIAVTDPLIEANNGTWRIDADGARRTDDPPLFTVDVATISAAYLGATPWWSLDAAGHLSWPTGTGGTGVVTADRLFASSPLPVCGSHF